MRFFVLSLVLFLFTACQAPEQPISKTKVDAIYTNGVIWTGHADQPDATTMAIDDGKIVAIGDRLPNEIASDVIIDLGGRFVMAGTLEAGKRADFVVLSGDPFKVDPNSLRDISVRKTIIGGDMVFERKPLSLQPSKLEEEWSVEWWLPRHEEKLIDKTKQPIDLLFIGDSITHDWEGNGKDAWDQNFAQHNGFNLGFSGDRTENVLWRLQNGAVDGLSPKLVVMMIGTNNTGHRMDSPEDTVEGIQTILEDLETRLPDSEVLLLSIFPRGKTADDPERIRNDEINARLASMAKKDHIHHKDIGHIFMDGDGVISETIMPDLLHLSPQGYQLWAEAIAADVDRLMGE